MRGAKQSRGTCAYCGEEMAKNAVSRHLAGCPKRQVAIAKAENGKGASEELYHLRIQPLGSSPFWLDLELRGSAPLEALDSYLRAIWLECCGHMSRFSEGGWHGDEIHMSTKARQVLKPGSELTHIYDYGRPVRLVNSPRMGMCGYTGPAEPPY